MKLNLKIHLFHNLNYLSVLTLYIVLILLNIVILTSVIVSKLFKFDICTTFNNDNISEKFKPVFSYEANSLVINDLYKK